MKLSTSRATIRYLPLISSNNTHPPSWPPSEPGRRTPFRCRAQGAEAGPGGGRRAAGSGGLWGTHRSSLSRWPAGRPGAERRGQLLTEGAQVLLEILVGQHLPVPGEVDRHFGGLLGRDGHGAGKSSSGLCGRSGSGRDPGGGRPGNVRPPGAGGSAGRRQLDFRRAQSPREVPWQPSLLPLRGGGAGTGVVGGPGLSLALGHLHSDLQVASQGRRRWGWGGALLAPTLWFLRDSFQRLELLTFSSRLRVKKQFRGVCWSD